MADTSTAPTATAQQLREATSRILGFRKVGTDIVDCLFSTGDFMTRDGGGVFHADGAGVGNGVVQPLLELKSASDAANNAVEILLTPLGAGQSRSAIGAVREGAGSGASVYIAAGNATVGQFTSSGNFGVGVSPQRPIHVKSGTAEMFRLETTSPRGNGNNYIGFSDPSGAAAFFGFGANSNDYWLYNNLNGRILFGTNNAQYWEMGTDGRFYPTTDNATPIGFSSNRISVGYSASNWIVTCDVRFKSFRGEPAPTPDEHAAVLECFDVFGFFQHLDAIERENDGGAPARWHFGPKAQAVWTIFANHGLAEPLGEDGLPPEGSVPPAFLCFDAWGEETAPEMAWWRPSDILGPDEQPIMVPCAEGEEGTEQRPTGETYVTREAGNIFGVRIDQLQSLMLVALHKRMNDLTDRVAALESPA